MLLFIYLLHNMQHNTNTIKHDYKTKTNAVYKCKIQTEYLDCPFKCGPDCKLDSIYCTVWMMQPVSVTYPNPCD